MTTQLDTDYTPGVAHFTCGGCQEVMYFAAKPICAKYERMLKVNGAGQKLRCAECLVLAHADLND